MKDKRTIKIKFRVNKDYKMRFDLGKLLIQVLAIMTQFYKLNLEFYSCLKKKNIMATDKPSEHLMNVPRAYCLEYIILKISRIIMTAR